MLLLDMIYVSLRYSQYIFTKRCFNDNAENFFIWEIFAQSFIKFKYKFDIKSNIFYKTDRFVLYYSRKVKTLRHFDEAVSFIQDKCTTAADFD